ncbi:hypothetical protein OPV22_011378 [Ensete ventricosum]|uniref:Uncharacterized protein n=2 Tax=Ensete ventricosum TaxID=4639 RepID=A0AAV8RJG3_ENSVE|nr:hypothetical protein OPV22_011378 [Ensete ventricosum]RWW25181.1 hypothetical protein GW17_00010488 [Ensete ventricosum]RWW61963.1 hypothetical protein BHE74_00030937 [Ensete ventricosum]
MWGGGNHSGKALERKRTANGGFHGGLSELFADDLAARTPTARSPRSFGGGTVGLGIVAAMSGLVSRGSSARSEPISIGSARVAAAVASRSDATEEEELSESYTRVIWHVGGSLAGKRVYVDEEKAAASSEPPGRGLHELLLLLQQHSGLAMNSSSWVG